MIIYNLSLQIMRSFFGQLLVKIHLKLFNELCEFFSFKLIVCKMNWIYGEDAQKIASFLMVLVLRMLIFISQEYNRQRIID